MDRASTASTKAALALLIFLFAANCYRAATQSITTDEALTFDKFVAPHLDEIFAHYDANNHVLNTALAWISVEALGIREFPLRLPSVLGGALYLWGVYRLARLVFGTGPFFLAAVALSALNPLLLDHLSAARGYGLALAFLTWALINMIEFLDASVGQASWARSKRHGLEDVKFAGNWCLERAWPVRTGREADPTARPSTASSTGRLLDSAESAVRRTDLRRASRKLELAAVSLGLCVAANLAFLYPVLALSAAFLIALVPCPPNKVPASICKPSDSVAPRHSHGAPNQAVTGLALSGKWRWDFVTDECIVPGVATAFVFLVLFLNHAEAGNFYFGAKTLDDAVTSLTVMSLYHNPGRPIFLGLHPDGFVVLRLLHPAVWIGLCVLILAGFGAGARILVRREQGETPADSLLVLCGLAMAFIAAAIIVANHWLGVPYPLNRTSLYWIPLSAFTSLALVRKVGWRPLTVPAIGLAALLSVQYLCEFNVRAYSEWWDQSGSRPAMQAIRRDAGSRNIRIGVSDTLEPILNFYRARHHIDNWARVERRPLTENYDYYLLFLRDANLVDRRHLTVLYRDSGLIAAR